MVDSEEEDSGVKTIRRGSIIAIITFIILALLSITLLKSNPKLLTIISNSTLVKVEEGVKGKNPSDLSASNNKLSNKIVQPSIRPVLVPPRTPDSIIIRDYTSPTMDCTIVYVQSDIIISNLRLKCLPKKE